MKTPILLVLAFIALSTLLHGTYHLDPAHTETSYSKEQVSQLNKLMDAQEPKRVILIPNEEMRRNAAIIALYADDGQPVNEAIRERQARAAAKDNHTSLAKRVYAER